MQISTEVGYAEISREVGRFLCRLGVVTYAQISGDGYQVIRLTPAWVHRLYCEFRGPLTIPYAKLSEFKYAARRALKDPEFLVALEAAMDGDVLIAFIQQQRGYLQ